ncbi:acyl-CoA N-acyltransferase [Mycena olivaceomarginata]|nr:acyl-CoA N-acyltransferase [Mycena olivaceomarginata]
MTVTVRNKDDSCAISHHSHQSWTSRGRASTPPFSFCFHVATMASASDVQIRPYRASDFPQVRALLFQGFLNGKRSVASATLVSYLWSAPMFCSYFLSLCGGFLLYYLPRWDRLEGAMGFLLLAFGLGIFLALRYAIRNDLRSVCEKALESDMRDIAAHYAAPGAFLGEEVLGFIGLESPLDKKSHTAELRRLVVSPSHRRRGLAKQLVSAAIAHVESVKGIDAIELSTSDFQRGVRKLVEGLGWEFTKSHLQWTGVGDATVVSVPEGGGGQEAEVMSCEIAGDEMSCWDFCNKMDGLSRCWLASSLRGCTHILKFFLCCWLCLSTSQLFSQSASSLPPSSVVLNCSESNSRSAPVQSRTGHRCILISDLHSSTVLSQSEKQTCKQHSPRSCHSYSRSWSPSEIHSNRPIAT